jgi:hypothetical protein
MVAKIQFVESRIKILKQIVLFFVFKKINRIYLPLTGPIKIRQLVQSSICI